MGFVIVTARIGNDAREAKEVDFLVDTGAFYTALPPALMRELGIQTRWHTIVTVADKSQIQAAIGGAYLALDGREGIILVAEMDVPMPLLGVTALETLGFKVDPVERRLDETRPFGPAALRS